MNIGFDAKRAFSNNTGLGNYSRDLIRILSENFPEVNYFLFKPKPSKNKYFEVLNNNQFIVKPQNKFYEILNFVWRMVGLKQQVLENKIDIYHGLSAEIPLGKIGNVKKVVTIHDLIFMTHPHLYSFFDRKIYFWKSKYAIDNADKIIAISEQTKADCIKYLGADASKIEVIYQGCSKIYKTEYAENQLIDLRIELKLPQKFILNVGTIETRKNALTIVKAIKNINTHLVLVGKKKKYFKEIEQYIFENKLHHKVIFLENIPIEQLAKLYQAASIFVYPSIYEGFGIPIIEALNSGTPVITTKGGCFEEAGGPNSIYIDPLNVAELESKINLLLNDDYLCKKMAKTGKEYAEKFSDENIKSKMMAVYSKVFESSAQLKLMGKFENT